MPIRRYDDFISQIGAGYWMSQPVYGDQQSSTAALLGSVSLYRAGVTKALPNPLPSSVTNYIMTRFSYNHSGTSSTAPLLAKVVNLGSIDISGASGTFTDGSTMPTVTECGVSRTAAGI